MEFTRLSDAECRESAQRGLQALHTQGLITDVELHDDLARLQSGTEDTDGEAITWIAR